MEESLLPPKKDIIASLIITMHETKNHPRYMHSGQRTDSTFLKMQDFSLRMVLTPSQPRSGRIDEE